MKKNIILVLSLLTLGSVAQYNNTYDVNANSDNLNPSFVITNKKAESITVSYASDAATLPRNDYFILTKHDAFGNVIYNNVMTPVFGPTDGLTNVEALIETDDEGVIVVGYHYDNSDHIEQPFSLKVDVNGNFQWAKIYYVNKKPIVKSQINKISLCRVFNDTDENYFISGSGDSDVNPGQDVATNVIKIDALGNMLFSKKYYNTAPGQFIVTRDYPGDIEFSKADKTFMITGYREESTANTKGRLMYFFGIDNAGTVITKFMTLASKSIPLDQDMIYDPNKNIFATTFTHAKNGYVPGTSSIIGFVTIDANLNIYDTKYLWHKEASQHNGRSISLCENGDYLLCSGIYDNNSVFVHNPAWLKVDPTGSPLSALLRYNIKDDVIFGHHATTFNPNSGEEEYVLINEQKTDLRMIRTTIGGKACGVDKFEPFVDKYDPEIATYEYDYKENGDQKDYKVYEKLFFPDYRKCDGDGTSYRTTGIDPASNKDNTITLYPSVVSAGNAYLILENNSGADAKIEILNVTGMLVYSNKQVVSGKTEVKLNTSGSLPLGMYLVKIYTADSKAISTSKILITE